MLKTIQTIEKEYTFDTFNANIAIEIGNRLVERAKKEKLPIVIDIATPSLTYYHVALEGATANNERFIARKKETVMRFFHSTWWVSYKVNHQSSSMHEKYGTNDRDFSILYGGWPILVSHLGVIGSICVSGLTQEEDNQLIMDALNEYFSLNHSMNQKD